MSAVNKVSVSLPESAPLPLLPQLNTADGQTAADERIRALFPRDMSDQGAAGGVQILPGLTEQPDTIAAPVAVTAVARCFAENVRELPAEIASTSLKKAITACALSIATPNMDAQSMAKLIEDIAKLPIEPKLTELIIGQTCRFITGEMDVPSRLELLGEIVSLSSTAVDFVDNKMVTNTTIFDQSFQLIAQHPQMDACSRHAVLFAVYFAVGGKEAISPDVINIALPFFSKKMDYVARANIMLGIHKAPTQVREELFAYVRSQLISPEPAPNSVAGVVYAAGIAAAAKNGFITPDVVANAERYFKNADERLMEKLGCLARTFIILAVQKIPTEERTDVVDHAILLITSCMRSWPQSYEGAKYSNEHCLLLALLASVPRQRRKEVAAYTRAFITEKMDAYAKASIFKKVDSVLCGEGGSDIVARALQLITPEMTNAYSRIGVLDAVRMAAALRMPPVTLDVVHAAAQFFVPDPSFSSVNGDIILEVLRTPQEERERVLLKVHQLITPGMDPRSIPGILYAVRIASHPITPNIVAAAARLLFNPNVDFLSTDANFSSMGGLILEIQNLPSEERDDVLTHASQLVTQRMIGADRLLLVRLLSRLSRDQRINFVRSRRADGIGPSSTNDH